MDKKISTFGNIGIEKNKTHKTPNKTPKSPISLGDVDIEKV